jgi:hypothetical protein
MQSNQARRRSPAPGLRCSYILPPRACSGRARHRERRCRAAQRCFKPIDHLCVPACRALGPRVSPRIAEERTPRRGCWTTSEHDAAGRSVRYPTKARQSYLPGGRRSQCATPTLAWPSWPSGGWCRPAWGRRAWKRCARRGRHRWRLRGPAQARCQRCWPADASGSGEKSLPLSRSPDSLRACPGALQSLRYGRGRLIGRHRPR